MFIFHFAHWVPFHADNPQSHALLTGATSEGMCEMLSWLPDKLLAFLGCLGAPAPADDLSLAFPVIGNHFSQAGNKRDKRNKILLTFKSHKAPRHCLNNDHGFPFYVSDCSWKAWQKPPNLLLFWASQNYQDNDK